MATANSPTGPWSDALGSLLCDNIDAEAFLDDNGQAYLYWGNGVCKVAPLSPNMIMFASPATTITPTNYTEGPYMLKRNG